MRFTFQHKAINQKEYGKAVSPLRYDSLALILSWSIFVVYGKQSEKNKYICSSKRHSALHTFWDTTGRIPKATPQIVFVQQSPVGLMGTAHMEPNIYLCKGGCCRVAIFGGRTSAEVPLK